jgi:hypothetical protein
MRTPCFLLSLTLFAPMALADPTPAGARAAPPTPPAGAPQPRSAAVPAPPPAPIIQLAPIDPATVPAACQPLAKQAQTPTLALALPARISLASCMAEHVVAPIALCDCGESIVAIDEALVPAIVLLDDVVAKGDPAIQMIADHTEGELYAALSVKLLATLPKLAPDAAEAETNLRDLRKQTLEAQLAPWRESAMTSFQHVVELAKAHPEIARRPAVAAAVRDSEQRLAADVAAR